MCAKPWAKSPKALLFCKMRSTTVTRVKVAESTQFRQSTVAMPMAKQVIMRSVNHTILWAEWLRSMMYWSLGGCLCTFLLIEVNCKMAIIIFLLLVKRQVPMAYAIIFFFVLFAEPLLPFTSAWHQSSCSFHHTPWYPFPNHVFWKHTWWMNALLGVECHQLALQIRLLAWLVVTT